VQKPAAGEAEGINLDFSILPGVNETDVTVRTIASISK
jgi:hypothetical protein